MADKTGWQVMFNTVTAHLMPLIVPVEGINVLGRTDSAGGAQPDFDLSPLGAREGGVSRQHAALLGGEDGVLILDLTSTNGTWLNQRRLTPNQPYPLRVGDTLRLGSLCLTIQIISRIPIEAQEDDTVITNAPRPPEPEKRPSLLDRLRASDQTIS